MATSTGRKATFESIGADADVITTTAGELRSRFHARIDALEAEALAIRHPVPQRKAQSELRALMVDLGLMGLLSAERKAAYVPKYANDQARAQAMVARNKARGFATGTRIQLVADGKAATFAEAAQIEAAAKVAPAEKPAKAEKVVAASPARKPAGKTNGQRRAARKPKVDLATRA